MKRMWEYFDDHVVAVYLVLAFIFFAVASALSYVDVQRTPKAERYGISKGTR